MIERKPVLVVVDVQNGFITEHSQPVVPVIVDLVRRWQAAHGDVVFSRYLNYPSSPFERLIGWTKMADSPETDFVTELAPYVGPHTPVVDKYIYTLFTPEGTQLVDEHGWTDLYLCGIDTDSCVLKTAVDAFERNLTPWILKDACASHAGPEAHAAGLFIAGRFIGTNQIIQTASLPESVLPLPA
ncbi:MAG TPA: cysteine hydrolase [Pseudonocardiaceae bacterium]|jgi:nicotinamidase-related amidase|nr:cysteine hydrolase [Pseudonocardiaceae bacterium]